MGPLRSAGARHRDDPLWRPAPKRRQVRSRWTRTAPGSTRSPPRPAPMP